MPARGARSAKRPAALILVAPAVAALTALSRPPAATAAADRLPDLGMARLRDLSIDTTAVPGRRLLRFTTVIVNVGAGSFETVGSRPDTSTTQMTVRQRIFNDAGSSRSRRTPAVMFWAGDGHEHWHVRDVEAYELTRLDNGLRVGTGRAGVGNLKGNELANVATEGLSGVIAAAWQGIERIRATWHLPYSFLHHCGLSVA
jgi:hypothetical protein